MYVRYVHWKFFSANRVHFKAVRFRDRRVDRFGCRQNVGAKTSQTNERHITTDCDRGRFATGRDATETSIIHGLTSVLLCAHQLR